MANISTLNPKHEIYIKELSEKLGQEGFAIDEWGIEKVAPKIKDSGVWQDFSFPALKLRTRFDLLVRDPLTGFICELDGKTIMFRSDTGNTSIEIWPVLFSLTNGRPRLAVFRDAGDKGVWTDQVPHSWLETIFMPDRWLAKERDKFQEGIEAILGFKPNYVKVIWKRERASGDPYFLWPIQEIQQQSHFIDAIRQRAFWREQW